MIFRFFIGWRSALRAAALALSALSLAWGIALTEGLVAAMLGAAAGSIAGEHMARSKLRLGVLLGACAAGVVIAWQLAALSVGTELAPRLIGPGATLRAAGCLRFGALAFATSAGLRATARRKPAAVAIELAFVAASITGVFAAHRDGIIARPLWLSDWAWRQGIDPAQLLLGVGGVAAGALAILLLLEAKSSRPVSSLVVVAGLALLAAIFVNAAAMPAPDPQRDLGLKDQPSRQAPQSGSTSVDGGSQGRASGAGGAEGAGSEERSARAGMRGSAGVGDENGANESGSANMGPTAVDSGSRGASTSSSGGRGKARPSSREELSDPNDSEDASSSPPPAPVAVVLLENDYSPPSQSYYFREDALSQFNGDRLVVSSLPGTDLDVPASFPVEPTQVLDPPPEGGRERVLTTVVLLADHTKPFALESPTGVSPARNPNPSRFKRAYRVESRSQSIEYKDLLGRAAGDRRWPAEVRAHYTDSPSDPRYGALARELAGELPPERRADPFALALAVKRYLDRELSYSTSARHKGASDPAGDMLFGDRIGYCVHFAHAAVFLWRSLGIPARIGVGYHYDEDQRKGGSTILLRSSDAHAWPELYLEGLGWIVLDIAAARNLDAAETPVDDELQRLLGQMARRAPPDRQEAPAQRLKIREILRTIGGAGVLLVALTVLVLYMIKAWRRLVPRFAAADALPVVGYRCALDLLAEAGFTRRFGETREDFARRVRGVTSAFEDLTWMHLSARLGRRDEGEGEGAGKGRGKAGSARRGVSPDALRAALARVQEDISAKSKRWRRLLGVVNPASFLDAR